MSAWRSEPGGVQFRFPTSIQTMTFELSIQNKCPKPAPTTFRTATSFALDWIKKTPNDITPNRDNAIAIPAV